MALITGRNSLWSVSDRRIPIVETPKEVLTLSLLCRLGERVGEPATPAVFAGERTLELQLHRVVPCLHPVIRDKNRGVPAETWSAPDEIHIIPAPQAVV